MCGLDLLQLDSRGGHIYIVGMSELLGTFEQIVLLAVLGLEDEAYGRAVLHDAQLASQEGRSISAGAVYATLDRMETKGLLCSRLEEGTQARGGRVRRFYRVTPAGAAALTQARTTLEKLWHGKRWPLEVL